MSKILRKVQNILKESLADNFNKSIKLTGIIQNIILNDNIFIVKTTDNTEYNKIIECHTNEPINNLKIGDTIFAEGFIKINTETNISIYLQLKYYCILSKKQIFENFIKHYDRLKHVLVTKYKNAIKRLEPKILPKMIYNTALLVMPENESHVENFKICFQEKCLGKLYVYHVKNKEGAVEEALKFFNKYHYIDLICLLTDQININDVKLLSTVTCVKYMLNRKEHPYIISIVKNYESVKNDPEKLIPLTALLSNANTTNIDSCTELIHNIQFRFKNYIEEKLEFGKNKLIKKMNNEKENILKLESELSKKLGSSLSNISNPSNLNKLEKIKNILSKKLEQEMNSLLIIKNYITENIVEDERVQYYYPIVIQSEKNTLVGKKTTNKDFQNISQEDFFFPTTEKN